MDGSPAASVSLFLCFSIDQVFTTVDVKEQLIDDKYMDFRKFGRPKISLKKYSGA